MWFQPGKNNYPKIHQISPEFLSETTQLPDPPYTSTLPNWPLPLMPRTSLGRYSPKRTTPHGPPGQPAKLGRLKSCDFIRVENGWDEDGFLDDTVWLASLESSKEVEEHYTEWLEYAKWYVETTSIEMDMCAIKRTCFPPQWAYY